MQAAAYAPGYRMAYAGLCKLSGGTLGTLTHGEWWCGGCAAGASMQLCSQYADDTHHGLECWSAVCWPSWVGLSYSAV